MKLENDGVIFELVDTLCTGSAVQDLLREYKPLAKDQIRVSAENKDDLVKKNLKKAVDAGVVPIRRVHDLVRDSEENGNQHIFYYHRRKSVTRDYEDPEAVARALFGKSWHEDNKFPKFVRMPNGTVWGDFRDGREEQPRSYWVAKLYEKAIHLEYVSEEATDGFLEKKYRRIESRVILLARFRPPGLLEIRVPQLPSRRGVEAAFKRLWGEVAQGVREADFNPWDLSKVRTALVRDQGKNEKIYRLGDSRFTDKDYGTATFSTESTEIGLFHSTQREKAVGVYMTGSEACKELVVTWLPTKATDTIQSELRTVVGAFKTNEVIVGSSTTGKAIDYVTNRLLSF